MDSKSEKLEIALRIQKRMLAETRQTLLETQEILKNSEIEVEALKEEIRTKQAVMDQKIEQAEAQLELVAQKDAQIEMLKHRVHNINEEYNRAYGGRITATEQRMREERQRAELEALKRGYTTLEDVYKMTGEPYSKDERC